MLRCWVRTPHMAKHPWDDGSDGDGLVLYFTARARFAEWICELVLVTVSCQLPETRLAIEESIIW
jgi:hypothetical protein